METNYTFKKQVKNKGYFASIFFEVKPASDELKIIYTVDDAFKVDNEYKVACEFGIALFREYSSRFTTLHYKISVVDIHWNPVDTTFLSVVYATVKGLCEITNIEIPGLQFNAETECFELPEARTLFHQLPGIKPLS